MIKHGFFPHNQGFTSPTPYPLEPCPFHSTLHCRSWLWFILIDVRVYMMSNYKLPDSTTNHRQISPLLNIHNQINGGDFALSSSPRLITIYTSCKWGQNRGHYNHGLQGRQPMCMGILMSPLDARYPWHGEEHGPKWKVPHLFNWDFLPRHFGS